MYNYWFISSQHGLIYIFFIVQHLWPCPGPLNNLTPQIFCILFYFLNACGVVHILAIVIFNLETYRISIIMGGHCHSAGGVPGDGRGVDNFSHRHFFWYEALVGGAQLSKSRLGLNILCQFNQFVAPCDLWPTRRNFGFVAPPRMVWLPEIFVELSVSVGKYIEIPRIRTSS